MTEEEKKRFEADKKAYVRTYVEMFSVDDLSKLKVRSPILKYAINLQSE